MRVAETAGTDRVPAGTAQKCGALSSGLRSPYWGLSGATNWELIQPFPRVFSTWTQSPSRPVAVNCVPPGGTPENGRVCGGGRPDVDTGTLQKDEIRVLRRGCGLGRHG